MKMIRRLLLFMLMWLAHDSVAMQIVNIRPPEQFPGHPMSFDVVGGLPPYHFSLETSSDGGLGAGIEVWAQTDGFTSSFILPDNMKPGKWYIKLWYGITLDEPAAIVVLKPAPPAVIFSVSPQIVKPGEQITIRGMQFDTQNILLYQARDWQQKSEVAIVTSNNGTIVTTVPSSLRPGYYRLVLDNRCGNLSQEEVYIYVPAALVIDWFSLYDNNGLYVSSKQIDGRLLFVVVSDTPENYYLGNPLPTNPDLDDINVTIRAQSTDKSFYFEIRQGITYGWKILWLTENPNIASGWSEPRLFFLGMNNGSGGGGGGKGQ